MRKNSKRALMGLAALCFSVAIPLASASADSTSVAGSGRNIQFTGYGSYEFGQVVKGEWETAPVIDHFWSHQVYAGFGFIADMNKSTKLVAGLEGKMWNVFPPGGLSGFDRASSEQHFSLWLTQASAVYSFGEGKNPPFQLEVGYFPYKYNSEVRNLGEFLFRSTVPGIIFNSFDFPAAKLLGAKGTFNVDVFGGNFKSDLLVLEQAAIWPFGDISVAYVGNYSTKLFTIGAGVDYASAIPVNSNYTQPHTDANMGPDSSFFSFQQVKIMGHLTVDPKPVLQDMFGNLSGVFGPQDFKVYGEAALLGTKNITYGTMGTTVMDTGTVYPWMRTPIMVGLNVPTFSPYLKNAFGFYFLDLLNVEFEHYAYPFVPSDKKQTDPGADVPNAAPSDWNAAYKNGNLDRMSWKWSVYAKRTITPGLAIVGQLSRDHTRLNYDDGYPTYVENLILPGEWQWLVKLTGNL